MNAAAVQLDEYTIEDIYNLPEGQRAELIDGELYMMATPSRIHQRIVMELLFRIRDYIGKNNGDCEVYPSPCAVFLNADDNIYVEPDISVICDQDKLTDEGCKGAPDWIIEIFSPSSKSMDYFTKLFKYQISGVREYWIVDPIKNQILVYGYEQKTMEQYSFGDDVPVGIYKGFSVKLQ